MKIKLIKSQWEAIGKAAGFVKEAQDEDSGYRQLRSCLEHVFKALESKLGVKAEWDPTYFTNVSLEKEESTDVRGESWIQVSHSRHSADVSNSTSVFHVERYYDNEFVQNEHGMVRRVVFNYKYPDVALSKVESALKAIQDGV